MKIHSATLNSPRLKRALAALRAYPDGLTTRQIIGKARVCAVNTVISELRGNGIAIQCTPEGRRNGASIYRYRLGK